MACTRGPTVSEKRKGRRIAIRAGKAGPWAELCPRPF
jgi:hypothetical protein